MFNGWKKWALGVVAALAALAGIAQMTPGHTDAHKIGKAVDQGVDVARPVIDALPDCFGAECPR